MILRGVTGLKLSVSEFVGWEWQGGWTLDTRANVDSDGWQYGSNFGLMRYPPGKGAESRGPLDVVRRRRWLRVRDQVEEPSESAEGPSSSQQPTPIADVSEGAMQASQASTQRQSLGKIAPGELLALPMGWGSAGKHLLYTPWKVPTGLYFLDFPFRAILMFVADAQMI